MPAFIARLRRHLEWSHANPERVRVDISTPHQFKGREADTVQVDPLLCAEVLDNVRCDCVRQTPAVSWLRVRPRRPGREARRRRVRTCVTSSGRVPLPGPAQSDRPGRGRPGEGAGALRLGEGGALPPARRRHARAAEGARPAGPPACRRIRGPFMRRWRLVLTPLRPPLLRCAPHS